LINEPTSEKRFPSEPILLIDDEIPWLKSLTFAFELRGGLNNFILCDDSREAMNILYRNDVSLVLLDLNMPYISGEELFSLIQRHDSELPIIILSGLNENHAVHSPSLERSFAHLGKTTDLQVIIETVRKALKYKSTLE